MFEGAIPALVTPFKNGEIDIPSFKRHIDWVIDNGVSAVVPCGTTGESATLSHEEHQRLIEITVDHVAGRVPVIAGTGSNSTREAVHLTRFAEKVGANGALVITPYYNKPTQKGLIEHFKAVSESVNIPIILYNVPGRTGVNMLPETVAKVAEFKNIVGIKEASGNLAQISEIIRLCDPSFAVISGDDGLTYSILTLGGKGVISVTANILPDKVSMMVKSALDGDWETARRIHFDLAEINKSLFIETNPIPVKTALQIMGRMNAEFRLPLTPMSEENRARLKKTLERYGVVVR